MADGKKKTAAGWWAEMRPQLVKYFRGRLRSKDAADDAAHDTYLRLAESNKPKTIRDRKRFTWTVAEGVALDWFKRRSRRRRLDAEYSIQRQLQTDTEELRTPERVSEGESEIHVLTRAADELPPDKKRVCEAALTGARPDEIAQQLGMDLRRVYRYLDHIYEHLTKAREASERGGRSDDE